MRLLVLAVLSLGLVTASQAAEPPVEKAYRNLTFSAPAGKPLRLDLYVPQQKVAPPLLIWIHGGGWRYGDKRIRLFVRHLTEQGFAVATIQYRMTWSAHWPAQQEDCIAAFDWLRSRGPQYGYNPAHIGLGGDSAGGHLAALLGVLEGRPNVDAVAVFYPVTDCVRLGEVFLDNKKNLLVRLFGGPFEQTRAAAYEASPINHVSRNSPPFLMIHGDKDTTVPLDQSQSLQAKLRQAGVDATLIVIPGQGHGFAPTPAMMRTVAAFYSRHLK